MYFCYFAVMFVLFNLSITVIKNRFVHNTPFYSTVQPKYWGYKAALFAIRLGSVVVGCIELFLDLSVAMSVAWLFAILCK